MSGKGITSINWHAIIYCAHLLRSSLVFDSFFSPPLPIVSPLRESSAQREDGGRERKGVRLNRAQMRGLSRDNGVKFAAGDLSRNINLEAASINLGPFVINGSWLRRIPCRGSRGFSIDFFLSLSLFLRLDSNAMVAMFPGDLPQPPISETEVKRRETVINASEDPTPCREKKKRKREREISGEIRAQDSEEWRLFNGTRGEGIRKFAGSRVHLSPLNSSVKSFASRCYISGVCHRHLFFLKRNKRDEEGGGGVRNKTRGAD